MQPDRVSPLLTAPEEAALRLLAMCFGAGSPEYVACLKHLVTVVHGQPWLDDEIDLRPAAGAPK